MYLMKYIRKDDRNHLLQMLKRSVNVYTIPSSSAGKCIPFTHHPKGNMFFKILLSHWPAAPEMPPTDDVEVGHEGLSFKHDSGMNEALALEFRQGRFAAQHMSVLADGEVHPAPAWFGLCRYVGV